jgi:creatinine amidohydrolase
VASGQAIFADTMAEMTSEEVAAAARGGAVALWAFGVIEQHGPHLPAGTDVYLPSARLRRVKALLAEAGISSVIVPPYYWGINHASTAFPASFRVRPAVMIELMADIFASLAGDGFGRVICITGHGDALHNQAICDAIKRSRAETGIDIAFAADDGLINRLEIGDEAGVIRLHPERGDSLPFPDVHAGRGETSAMLALCPDLVRDRKLPSLSAVAFTPGDLAEWRQGGDHAKRKTPQGYVGDPAQADAARGAHEVEAGARLLAEAVRARCARAEPAG